MADITPARKLFDLLVSRDFDPEMLDSSGKPAADPAETEIYSFDFRAQSGKDYGTVVIMLGDDNDLEVYCSDNVGRSMEGDDKNDWFAFLEQLKNFAVRNFMTFGIKNLNRLRYSMQGQAAIKEGLFESWTGNRTTSWNGAPTEARLMIRHKKNIAEGDARFRYIESLFIETADSERYKLPFTSLTAGRAMLEHVRQGGRPYDARGNHISEIVTELAVLSRFRRANQGQIFEGDTQQLVEQVKEYQSNLQRSLKGLGTRTGYTTYFESWSPAEISEQDVVIESLKNLFVKQSIDTRIESALPLLAKIQQQGTEMKEANIFEAWVERLAEGTWALPDTPEKQDQLIELLSTDLPVGADATNATEQLYDLVGDDELFDQLGELADRDANADARQVIMDRLQELSDFPEVRAVLDQLQIDATAEMNPPEATNPADLEQTDEAMFPGSAIGDKLRDFKRKQGQSGSAKFAMGMMPAAGAGAMAGSTMATTAVGASALFAPALGAGALGGAAAALGGFLTYKGLNWLAQKLFGTKEEALAFADAHLKAAGSGQPQFEFQGKTYPVKINSPQEAQQLLRKIRVLQSQIDESDLNSLRRTAGLTENVLTDSTGSTFQHILDTFKRDVRDFKETGEVSDELHNALYDYYFDDMPYGTKKARDGDPYEWVADRFGADLGIDGYGGNSPGIPDSDYGMERESVGDYADEYQDSLSGILKIAGVPAKPRPAPEYDHADMEEGLIGTALGGIGGALVGGPAGARIGASLGNAIGNAMGSDDKTTDEAVMVNPGTTIMNPDTEKMANPELEKHNTWQKQDAEADKIKWGGGGVPAKTSAPQKSGLAAKSGDVIDVDAKEVEEGDIPSEFVSGARGQPTPLDVINYKDYTSDMKSNFGQDWKPDPKPTGPYDTAKLGSPRYSQPPAEESIDPTNPRDYEIPAIQRKGQEPLTAKDIEQKDRKAEFDYYQRAHGRPHPDSATEESRSPLAGQYGHAGKMKEVSKDVSFLDRLKELSGMKK